MKSLAIKFLNHSITRYLIKAVAILLFYDRKIFSSRHFRNPDGYIWLLKSFWFQRVLGFNRFATYPIDPTTKVSRISNLDIHPDSINNLMSPGCYFQNFNGLITVEKDVYIAPNVGIITANHKIGDIHSHEQGRNVRICSGSWVGMNSVVLPGVEIGPNTVVAAGSVVTRSFPDGNCLLAGSPAVIKRRFNKVAEY